MAVRHGYGKIAGTDALVFAYDTGDTRNSYRGEPTTNLISPTGIDMSVLSTYSELIRNQVIDSASPSGYACEMEVGNAGNINASSRIQFGTATNIPTSGNTFISVWVKFQGGTFANITPRVYTGVNWYDMSPLDGGSPYLTSEYRRFGVYAPMGTASGGPNPGFSMTQGSESIQTGQKTRWHSPQVEQKDHVTPFVNGTRSATQGLLDLTGNSTIDLGGVTFDSNAQVTFDGTSDYISLSPVPDINQRDYSLETIVYRASTGVLHGIWTDVQYGFFGVYISSANVVRFKHMTNPTYASTDLAGSTTIGVGTYHIVNTYSTTEGFKTYVNGVLDASTSATTAFTLSSGRGLNKLGVYENGAPSNANSLNGKIHVAKAYHRVLTAAEVLNNYNFYKGRFGI